MSRFQQVFERFTAEHFKDHPRPAEVDPAEKYILRGDPKHLKSIKQYSLAGWDWALAEALAPPGEFQDEDRRVVQAIVASGMGLCLGRWLGQHLRAEKPNEDSFGPVREALLAQPRTAKMFLPWVGSSALDLEYEGRPTSAGRFMLGLPDNELAEVAKRSGTHNEANAHSRTGLVEFLIAHAPERILVLGDGLFAAQSEWVNIDVAELLVNKGGVKFIPVISKFLAKVKDPCVRYFITAPLAERQPAEFLEIAEKAGLDVLRGTSAPGHCRRTTEWLLDHVGDSVIPKIAKILGQTIPGAGEPHDIVDAIVQKRNRGALPVLREALKREQIVGWGGHVLYLEHYYLVFLKQLVAIKEDCDDELIVARIQLLLNDEYNSCAEHLFPLAIQSRIPAAIDLVWARTEHASKPMRRGAAQALAALGDEAVPRAEALLRHRKAELRETAIQLLQAVGTPRAKEVLRARLPEEKTARIAELIREAVGEEPPSRRGR